MDDFYEHLIIRAATIDELLSDDFEPLPGQKNDTDEAARRLAAWCRSCASGDWSLFSSRVERDGLSIAEILTKFARVRRRADAPAPAWIHDAMWVEAALQSETKAASAPVRLGPARSRAFEHLFTSLVDEAERRLWSGITVEVSGNLAGSARDCLRDALLQALSRLCAPALYERFVKTRNISPAAANPAAGQSETGAAFYDHFIAGMKAGGLRDLFNDKPVLLRLIATTTRQWIDTSREFVLRLHADLETIRGRILRSGAESRVAELVGDVSDPHNNGRSVRIVRFEDGTRIVYKPKDLRLDAAWHALVERLNRADPPTQLRTVQTIAREGYGWTEFIEHAGCASVDGFNLFFRRAGAWLALFHCFAGGDMHQENIIAAGDHPVPIDLEVILQTAPEEGMSNEAEAQAFEAANEIITNSVMMVGLLPAYGKSPGNKVFAVGGMTSGGAGGGEVTWENINSDRMRPAKPKAGGELLPNMPHVAGLYAKFGDHVDDFIAGFEDYAKFLLHQSRDIRQGGLFDDFAGLLVRKVVRPTRFYYMLLQRLKNHKTMGDGVIWSAQADFIARLADWHLDTDPRWPLQRAERLALLQLNVPHFVSPSDGSEIGDATGISVPAGAVTGLERARMRVRSFDEPDIAWQVAVIRQNTSTVSGSQGQQALQRRELLQPMTATAPSAETLWPKPTPLPTI